MQVSNFPYLSETLLLLHAVCILGVCESAKRVTLCKKTITQPSKAGILWRSLGSRRRHDDLKATRTVVDEKDVDLKFRNRVSQTWGLSLGCTSEPLSIRETVGHGTRICQCRSCLAIEKKETNDMCKALSCSRLNESGHR